MHPQLIEKLITSECSNLTQFATNASKIEHFILEKEYKRVNQIGRGPHLVSIMDSDNLMGVADSSEK